MDLLENEYPPYFKPYIEKAQQYSDAFEALEEAKEKRHALASSMAEKADYAYAEGKWTIKEMLCHIIDAERIFCYRALRFARNDNTDLSGYDHDTYVPESNTTNRSIESIIQEMDTLRVSTIQLFQSFNEELLARRGTANNNQVSVLATAYIIPGHELHHLAVLEERYLK